VEVYTLVGSRTGTSDICSNAFASESAIAAASKELAPLATVDDLPGDCRMSREASINWSLTAWVTPFGHSVFIRTDSIAVDVLNSILESPTDGSCPTLVTSKIESIGLVVPGQEHGTSGSVRTHCILSELLSELSSRLGALRFLGRLMRNHSSADGLLRKPL
jgi:hypothetical protein